MQSVQSYHIQECFLGTGKGISPLSSSKQEADMLGTLSLLSHIHRVSGGSSDVW